MQKIAELLKKYCPMSFKDWMITLFLMAAGSSLCISLQQITTSDTHVPLIFVLVVLLVALLTNGYFYGILTALASVFAVNWAFTYPYQKLDFSIYGYPLTFITMLAVGVACSMLASGLKERERLMRLSEAERTRATLLRSISHDLRTPLTSIGGSISAVLDNGLQNTDLNRELLENAREDVDWLYRVVENLLSVTEINGKGCIQKKDELLEEVLNDVAYKFRNSHPSVSVEINCPEEPLFVPMDAVLITQVLKNLMENAVIHGERTDRILLSVRDLGEEVGIYVKDNGKGINRRMLPHLFDGTINAESGAGEDSSRFIGLGLSVCKAVTEAHGGTISAHNPTSGGAEFMFTLPKGENLGYQR